jgi:signal transduction histidine kinase
MFLIIAEEETTLFEWSDAVILLVLAAAELLLILSFAVAITKYRLYDIDVVISKTVTYGALALFITVVYVAIVAGLGSLFGAGDEPNLAVAIAATGAVALMFEPIRSRLQRWANRLVYGERATPYEVLARFSKRAATAEHDEEMLERIPRLIVAGTGASEATLWIAADGGLQAAAWWPGQGHAAGIVPVGPDELWSDPAADYSVPVEHAGELLGGLSLVASRGGAIAPAEEELVQNLAGGLVLVLRNARLTDDLRVQVGQLAASRERILYAADEARRDLEQDLDMGPQQELVAVKVKLGVVKSRAEAAEATKTAEVLNQLERDVGTAIESVRDFARGVYPPLLEAEGLAAAISAEGDKSALPVALQAGKIGRYPRELETAVFFSTLEALQNAAKYGEARSATVILIDDGNRLSFEVRDDGRGFDPDAVRGGTGIPGMADRLDSAGGTLKIESAPGRGTSVRGSVPI